MYLKQVGKYLPLKKRKEIIAELRSEIENRLVGNDEEEIKQVLTSLGNPRFVAMEYTTADDGYYIESKTLVNYKYILQLLILIGVFSIPIAGVLELITANGNFWQVLAVSIHRLFLYIIFCVGILTIIFYFVNKYKQEDTLNKGIQDSSTWSINDLKVVNYSLNKFYFETGILLVFFLWFVWFINSSYLQNQGYEPYLFYQQSATNLLIGLFGLQLVLTIISNFLRFKFTNYSIPFFIFAVLKSVLVIGITYMILIKYKLIYIPSIISGYFDFDVIAVIFWLIVVVEIINCLQTGFRLYIKNV